MLKLQVNRYSLNIFLMLVKNFHMILFFNIPNKNALIHTWRNDEARVTSPPQVKNIFCVAHQTSLWWPAEYFIWAVDGQAILTFLPESYALVIGSRSEVGAIRGVTNYIDVFIAFTETIENAKVLVIWVERSSIFDDLPYFYASFCALSFLLHELFLIRTCRGELIRERMEVNGQDAVLQAVPADVRGINAHKLAVDYIIIQRTTSGSPLLVTSQILLEFYDQLPLLSKADFLPLNWSYWPFQVGICPFLTTFCDFKSICLNK